ncbi:MULTISPECIES: helix-turn-helix domain-containing protein [unclassified Amycolatopsis]|uniref:helix-turn-helix domain-containing protein n=1 Tax=unclassified Amycolatopsis TaxID=2618356 RepID=UPI00287404C4|nr:MULTISPECIES: helix-turn-helix domain-containing protein [unclassified Amycolatopsis]MDS0140584.1 helix-turn-helix transcriptional regulator [Amycolatopsis sp. 505]MDS0149234.1 helix-turn-helix transcriptional regulator [Amycolatopsis sp. CM201R]
MTCVARPTKEDAVEGGNPVSTVEQEGRKLPTLGQRIYFLFERIRRPDGEKWTHEQVATFVAEKMGVSMGRQYISVLIRDRKANPSRAHLQGLAMFFGVSAAYFFDDEKSAEIARQVEVAVALRDPRTRQLALRLLQATEPSDVSLVADVVGAIGDRPALRHALEVLLSLDDARLQAAVDVLKGVTAATGSQDAAS